MSRRFSRLHCPANQPHIFKTCIRIQTRNVIVFIPIHCVHYVPVPFKPAPSSINCRSTRYTTMFCLPHLAISHTESSGQIEIFNQLLEQTLRCTIHQLGETRNWVEVLPTIEFAVNNTPNRTTGYSAFYLNYGYHPLHPL